MLEGRKTLGVIALLMSLPAAGPAPAQDTHMSDVIATIAVNSTFDPQGFEDRLLTTRGTMTGEQMEALRSCLQRLNGIGADAMRSPPPSICIAGRCSPGDNPLADLATWSSSVTAALDGRPWTQTASGARAVVVSGMLLQACPLMPGLCDEIPRQTFVHFKAVARVCD